MPNDVAGTLAGLDALAQRVNDATMRIVMGAAGVYRNLAMINAPVGEEGNSTNPPGDLSRSMVATDPVGGDGEWSAMVGPTVETDYPGPGGTVFAYGRQREFGGVIYPRVTPYLAFVTHGVFVRKPYVYQEGAFYLTRARDQGTDQVQELMSFELTAAINGY